MVDRIHIVYEELPPSTNHLLIKGSILTKGAREYKARFKQHVVQHVGLQDIMQLDQNALYAVHLSFYFESVLNKSYNDLNLPPSRRAKTRYKKFDLDNRIKFLADCIKDALAIDDCQTFASSQEKHQDPERPRVEITVAKIQNIHQFGL